MMIRARFFKIMLWAATATITVGRGGWNGCALAAEEKPAAQASNKIKTFRGRLPPYYSLVVTKEQREKIYMIQAEYRPKITALQAQLEALINEEKEKISAVLTEQQKKKIAEARAGAKGRKDIQQADAEKADNALPAEIPTESQTDK